MQLLLQRFLLFVFTLIPLGGAGVAQDDDPNVRSLVHTLEALFGQAAPDFDAFATKFIDKGLLERVGMEAVTAHIGDMTDDLRRMDLEFFFQEEDLLRLVFVSPRGREDVGARIRPGDGPLKLSDLWILGFDHLDPKLKRDPSKRAPQPREVAPIRWSNLDQRLEEEAAAGFSGAVLVVRGDELAYARGFGLANREKSIPITMDTVFAIGSVPIDFTKAGILLLMDAGLIRSSETLPDFFEDVPADKRDITVGQLMSGASGLQNFHDIPGDRDPDHTWIERDEAVRRIFSLELLFPPGTGREHSHSAWGLLAAMIEIRTGESYQDFTRSNLFEPADMGDTGFNGDPVEEARLALGYDAQSDGERNAPPYWGPCSWLVMGSGGMVSTVNDMDRWFRALRAGKILEERALAKYWSPPGSPLLAGDAYGFEIFYTEGPGSRFILLGNAVGLDQRPAFNGLGKRLLELVKGGGSNPFVLGVEFAVDHDRVMIQRVVPGSAAERDGLKSGDRVLTVEGVPALNDLVQILDENLRTGKQVAFVVQRDGKTLEIFVTPKRR